MSMISTDLRSYQANHFPTGLLPDPVKPFARQAAAAIGCDPAMVALPTIAALGATIGNTRRIKVKSDWHEPPIFWPVVVASSGTAKSPALKTALGPLHDLQSAAFEEHRNFCDLHDIELEQHDDAIKQWKKSNRDPDRRPVKPHPPTATRYIVNDTTSEALIRVLSENPRGVLAVNDELVAWFKSFDAYRNGRGGDVGRWLSMWSGGPLTVDRKGSETIHVPSACVSITGTIQPQTLRDTLGVSLIENGMAARLLFAMPARRTLKWSDKEIPAATNESMQSLYATLTQLRFNENDGRPSSVLVPMTADAEQLWVKFFGDWAAEQAAATDEQAAMMSKLVAYAARFALLFHMIQVAAGDREAIDEEAVDEQNIVAATHLARWFADEAARIHAMLSESGDQRRTRELVELCQAAGGEVSVRDLQRRLVVLIFLL